MKKHEREIAEAIHYPDCWDTMAYPTLTSALWETILFPKGSRCPTCDKSQGTISSEVQVKK